MAAYKYYSTLFCTVVRSLSKSFRISLDYVGPHSSGSRVSDPDIYYIS